MLDDRGHMRAMRLLPFAAAAVDVLMLDEHPADADDYLRYDGIRDYATEPSLSSRLITTPTACLVEWVRANDGDMWDKYLDKRSTRSGLLDRRCSTCIGGSFSSLSTGTSSADDLGGGMAKRRQNMQPES